jgi:serine/threonine-protein kinase
MIGRTVSHYRILERLGEGGMGVVYLAEDLALKRRVALKFLPADATADSEARARLTHEAQAAASLLHPNICPVYEIGDTDGQTFIVMAHLEGKTLRDRLHEGPLRLAEALSIARQVGEALAAAHAKGIVHRDVKPGNVMLTADARPVLMDFGLAHVAGATKLTRTGTTLGTAAYMSPEQAQGREADAHSDVWALGVVLYELASGRVPFVGESELAQLYAIVNAEPEPLTAIAPGVPAGLNGIVTRALAKEVSHRYASAADMVADLAELERDLTAEPAGHGRRTRRRHAWQATSVSLGAVALVVVLAALNVGGVRDRLFEGRPRIRSIAVLPLANLSGDPQQEYFADGMTAELINDLGKVSALRVISRTSAMSYKGAKKTLRQIARELNVDAIVEGSVQRSGERVKISAELIRAREERQLWADSYERDLKDVLALQGEVAQGVAEKIRVALTPEERSRLAPTRKVNPEAYDACLRGWSTIDVLSIPGWHRAVQLFQRAIELDPGYAPAYAGLAYVYTLLGDYEGSVQETMARCRPAIEKALALDPNLADAHLQLAVFRRDWEFDWSGAVSEFRRAIELNPSSALAHVQFASCFRSLGRIDEDREEVRKARALDPLNRFVAEQPGWCEHFARRYGEAEKDFRTVLASDSLLPQAHGGLGLVLEQQGRRDQAIAELKRACELIPYPAYACALGHAYGIAGRAREAQALLDSLLRSPKLAVGGVDVAAVYVGLGERERALDWIERGVQDRLGMATFLRVDPRFDALHGEPRFKAALHRIGLD